jgi:hypothetical protein
MTDQENLRFKDKNEACQGIASVSPRQIMQGKPVFVSLLRQLINLGMELALPQCIVRCCHSPAAQALHCPTGLAVRARRPPSAPNSIGRRDACMRHRVRLRGVGVPCVSHGGKHPALLRKLTIALCIGTPRGRSGESIASCLIQGRQITH